MWLRCGAIPPSRRLQCTGPSPTGPMAITAVRSRVSSSRWRRSQARMPRAEGWLAPVSTTQTAKWSSWPVSSWPTRTAVAAAAAPASSGPAPDSSTSTNAGISRISSTVGTNCTAVTAVPSVPATRSAQQARMATIDSTMTR